jgi:flagellar hook-associated protein 1 FlgK
MGILGTSISGLMAAQRSLETASHNIANVNTDGYSRQRAEYGTRPAEFTGAGYIGQGVNATTVARSYDQFIANQLTASTSSFAEADGFSTMAAQVDNIVSSAVTGLPVVLKSFFNAVNEVASNPTSVPVRQVMVSEAEAVSKQFNNMSSQFEVFRSQTNNQMQAMVTDINAFAKSIAEQNNRIVTDASRSLGKQMPNDLLDQRDALLTKIAEKVSVSTINQSDGSIAVFIGTGQSLVLGATSSTLFLAGSSADSSHKEILINGQNITQSITGGTLNGALRFRDTVLDPAQQQLGLVSAGFAVEFNRLHTTSAFDLNGNAGTNMFSFGTPALAVSVAAATGSTGTITAVYDPANTGNLNPSDYRLDYNGATYSLTRLSDNTLITLPGTFPGTPASVQGMTITQAVPPTGVSSFLIRPTFDAAKNIKTLITDPVKIAAAGTTGGPGVPIPGDNSVALNLAALENKPLLFGAKSTLNDVYGQLISNVATLTHSAKVSRSAQEVLFNSAKQSRENLAGVNLDEEAANLIKFQNAYQASAQAISAASSMFDVLIAAVR